MQVSRGTVWSHKVIKVFCDKGYNNVSDNWLTDWWMDGLTDGGMEGVMEGGMDGVTDGGMDFGMDGGTDSRKDGQTDWHRLTDCLTYKLANWMIHWWIDSESKISSQ